MEARPQPPHFLSLLNDVFDQEDKDHITKTGYNHNPSSATMVGDDGEVVGACMRALYWKATGEPVTDKKDFTVKMQGMFGGAIHDAITDKLSKSGKIKLTPESPGKLLVDPLTHEISFRLDGLVSHLGELGCLEIKTQQSWGLQRMVREGGPKKSDILQVLCYFGTNEDIRWASLVYVARDTAFRAEYHIYKDPETKEFVIKGITPTKAEKPLDGLSFERVVSRWKELEGHVDRKELPKRDFKAVLRADGTVVASKTKNYVEYKTAFQCMYCSWRTLCWTQPDALENSVKIGGH